MSLTVNDIEDITPLQSLTNLEYLFLDSSNIADLQPLATLTNLKTLSLYDKRLTTRSPSFPLADLNQLWYLALGNNRIRDLPPLAALSQLQSLFVFGNGIVDVAPLQNLTELRSLSFGNNPITDIAPMTNLGELEELLLFNTQVTVVLGFARLHLTDKISASSLCSVLIPISYDLDRFVACQSVDLIKSKTSVGWVDEGSRTPASVAQSPFLSVGTALPILHLIPLTALLNLTKPNRARLGIRFHAV
ncbi:hypothetical protein H6F86_14005 [Phormidium sp. FACHB-592]|uniref:Leucine-rich repeat domain-containing protein n=1 Tax=Stenomitos frigidus AS-A4 TaxID=2933935 RepID=A0ABV0KQC1_9CYAN|nr:leucine-rich repeat domain-containing protein [Phormidium sp. FACHB-592]MBD2074987.1 hypothetical protein [Phormidium sp. FACHB-592]